MTDPLVPEDAEDGPKTDDAADEPAENAPALTPPPEKSPEDDDGEPG